jgi:hypothetical protein
MTHACYYSNFGYLMANKIKPKDPTVATRVAAVKARAEAGGGKRTCLTLEGHLVSKLDALVLAGFADNHTNVIRKLIDRADAP